MDKNVNWRQMRPEDLDAVMGIATLVHPDFPEERRVFADKLRLHAGGALVLESAQRLVGYCFAHPWHSKQPPPLNRLLDTIPANADAFYLHDVALLPETRGMGAGTAVMDILLAKAVSLDLHRLCLIAVNGSIPYWSRHGFSVDDSPELQTKLSSYGNDARVMVRSCASHLTGRGGPS